MFDDYPDDKGKCPHRINIAADENPRVEAFESEYADNAEKHEYDSGADDDITRDLQSGFPSLCSSQ